MKTLQIRLTTILLLLATGKTPPANAAPGDVTTQLTRCSRPFAIYTPESLPSLMKIEERLGRFGYSGDPHLDLIYHAVSDDILHLKEKITRVRHSGMDQYQVAEVVDGYNRTLEFPMRFLAHAAHLLDYHESIGDWNTAVFLEVDKEWRENRNRNGVMTFLPKFTEWYRKVELTPRNWIDHEFLINGMLPENTGYPFFFQYKYVYKEGYLPLMEFIRSRESGIVYIGISESIAKNYDGQHAYASLFTKHDYFHAFFQKHRDHLLFSSLGIKNEAGVAKLRKLNADRLDQLISEWGKIPDQKLKYTVRALLFALLHEQSHSYPMQVRDELTNKKKLDFYLKRIPANLRGENTVDPKTSGLIKGEEDRYVKSAIKWLTPFAIKDSEYVLQNIKN